MREAAGRPLWVENLHASLRFLLAMLVGALCAPSSKVVQCALTACAASPTVSAAPLARRIIQDFKMSDVLDAVCAPCSMIVQGALHACAASPTVWAAPIAKGMMKKLRKRREKDGPKVDQYLASLSPGRKKRWSPPPTVYRRPSPSPLRVVGNVGPLIVAPALAASSSATVAAATVAVGVTINATLAATDASATLVKGTGELFDAMVSQRERNWPSVEMRQLKGETGTGAKCVEVEGETAVKVKVEAKVEEHQLQFKIETKQEAKVEEQKEEAKVEEHTPLALVVEEQEEAAKVEEHTPLALVVEEQEEAAKVEEHTPLALVVEEQEEAAKVEEHTPLAAAVEEASRSLEVEAPEIDTPGTAASPPTAQNRKPPQGYVPQRRDDLA